MRRLSFLGVVLLVAACSGASTATVAPASVAPSATPSPTPTPTPLPTPTPTPPGPVTFALGATVTVLHDGADWAEITVSDAKVVASYKGSYGYVEKPQVAGNVFIQAKVTYEALQDGVSYNPYDWQVFCADEAVNNYTIVLYGPKPELGSGTLPAGRKASGYVVYEVPKTGEVVMSYRGSIFSDRPVFEVIIRTE